MIASGLGQLTWGFEDVLRVLIACSCVMLIGTNIAVIAHAKHLFTPESFSAWRMFFLAKSLITFSVGLGAYMRAYEGEPILWRTYVAAVGVLFSNIALVRLYRCRHALGDHVTTAAEVETKNAVR